MRRLFIAVTFIFCVSRASAQPNGGAPYARYDVHAALGFPEGAVVGARMRVVPILSVEASLGFLPFTPAYTVGVNFHTYPTLDIDPAFSLLGTLFQKNGTHWYAGSLMFGFLSLRKTSLHGVIRGGATLLYGQHPDGSRSIYPVPTLEVGLAYGLF